MDSELPGDCPRALLRGELLMSNNMILRIAGIFGFCAVGLGAFGAHGLKDLLVEHGTTAVWEKAVFYHFVHTIMMVLVAQFRPTLKGVALSYIIGIAVFSGSLYLLAVTGVRWLGAITPIGGVSFLIGWGLLAWNGTSREAN